MGGEEDMKAANVKGMRAEAGYDVTIVCCSSAKQAQFWTARLGAGRGSVVPEGGMVVAVDEDWAGGGAGNGLGTLYAWTKACKELEATSGRDVAAELAQGRISAALYHTAGKGTRMAPLPGSENNNKPGVKLPARVDLRGEGGSSAVSILESVIRQTGAYAGSRKGRLSVYWGDQVFVPSKPTAYTPTHHADILCSLIPMPDAATWAAKGLQNYGLIAVNGEGNAAQVEKVDYPTADKLLKSLGVVESVGTSLGSFSLSAALLSGLVAEFAPELGAKVAKMDTDPHWWMPLTLARTGYADLMAGKGVAEAESQAHWDRMDAFKARVLGAHSGTPLAPGGPPANGLFGAVDVGDNCYWWDYGQLKFYLDAVLLLARPAGDTEAEMARQFFGCGLTASGDAVVTDCAFPETTAKVSASVLANVHVAGAVEAKGAVLVNVSARSVKAGPGCILYNVCSNEDIVMADGDVRVGVFTEDAAAPYFEMKSRIDIDSGKAFKDTLPGNTRSFQDVYDLNADADCAACTRLGQQAHADLRATFA